MLMEGEEGAEFSFYVGYKGLFTYQPISEVFRPPLAPSLADFPAVFLHISNFDICHEIQQAVVTAYRA